MVTGALNEDLPPAEAIVKVWADPHTNDVYVNNGWNALSKYDGLTGRGGPIPIKAIDLAIGPDGNLYLYGRAGWNEPIYRCDRQFKPVAFSGTGKPTTTKHHKMPWGRDRVQTISAYVALELVRRAVLAVQDRAR